MLCPECHGSTPRATPLLGARACLEAHEQYVCSTCGRCVCIQKDPARGVQRWQFPFRTAEIANLYRVTAEVTCKKPCGIYAITDAKGRVSYKIFPGEEELNAYLQKNRGKTGSLVQPAPESAPRPAPGQIRRLTPTQVEQYLQEQQAEKA